MTRTGYESNVVSGYGSIGDGSVSFPALYNFFMCRQLRGIVAQYVARYIHICIYIRMTDFDSGCARAMVWSLT